MPAVSRRGFLGLLAGVTGTALVLPRRTFFLPPVGGWRPQDYTLEDVADHVYALPFPFQRPNPVLSQMLQDIETLRDRLSADDEHWARVGQYRAEQLNKSLAASYRRVIESSDWAHLVIPS
jgi:hypothetical protein